MNRKEKLQQMFDGVKRIDSYQEVTGSGNVIVALRMPVEGYLMDEDLYAILDLFRDYKSWNMRAAIVNRPDTDVVHYPPRKDIRYELTLYGVNLSDSAPR